MIQDGERKELAQLIDLLRAKGVVRAQIGDITLELGPLPRSDDGEDEEWAKMRHDAEEWAKRLDNPEEPNHMPLPKIRRGPPTGPDEIPRHMK